MLTKKDYCDKETSYELDKLGYPRYHYKSTEIDKIFVIIPLFAAQKWLREEKGIHIAPRIYLYHDINLDEQTSWECTIYVEWSAIYTIGKSLTYEDALLLGIKEAVKLLKNK